MPRLTRAFNTASARCCERFLFMDLAPTLSVWPWTSILLDLRVILEHAGDLVEEVDR